MENILLVLKDGVLTFFLYAIVAVFAQNAIFNRALGVSRLLKLVEDPTLDTLLFGVLLCIIQVVSCVLGFFANKLFGVILGEMRFFVRPLLMVLCMAVAYVAIFFLVVFFYKKSNVKTVVEVLPLACFNCCILGTLLTTVTRNYTFLETLAFAIGSAVGYVLAVLLVTEGQRKLRNRNIPQSFKGLPANLVYIGILALAIYGFTGHMPVF
ncbi:MAG: Rnf-Nqr domain containing protein [Oscillospiraceae bacterium]